MNEIKMVNVIFGVFVLLATAEFLVLTAAILFSNDRLTRIGFNLLIATGVVGAALIIVAGVLAL